MTLPIALLTTAHMCMYQSLGKPVFHTILARRLKTMQFNVFDYKWFKIPTEILNTIVSSGLVSDKPKQRCPKQNVKSTLSFNPHKCELMTSSNMQYSKLMCQE